MQRVAIVGTGLVGGAIGLALRGAGYSGTIEGVDRDEGERREAVRSCGMERVVAPDGAAEMLQAADAIVLAVPVLGILEWMERLAPVLRAGQMVTDVGSTKARVAGRARELYGVTRRRAVFLPGHPMAGKESGGAALAEAGLFRGATWLFTPVAEETERTMEWRGWVRRMGAHVQDLDPERHDELCAWVSHLPQFVATALASLLEERFGEDPVVGAVGGRAIREMTRLGASPYSMWRDVALTNGEAVGQAMSALEQQMAHLRENLQGPELREMFRRANQLRLRREQP